MPNLDLKTVENLQPNDLVEIFPNEQEAHVRKVISNSDPNLKGQWANQQETLVDFAYNPVTNQIYGIGELLEDQEGRPIYTSKPDLVEDFIDISQTGTPVDFSQQNNNQSQAIPIGFSFEFYNNNYEEVYVDQSGYLNFDGQQPHYDTAWPSTPFFDDTFPLSVCNSIYGVFIDSGYEIDINEPTSGVFYQTVQQNSEQIFVVQWNKMINRRFQNLPINPDNPPTVSVTFQIQLHSDPSLNDLNTPFEQRKGTIQIFYTEGELQQEAFTGTVSLTRDVIQSLISNGFTSSSPSIFKTFSFNPTIESHLPNGPLASLSIFDQSGQLVSPAFNLKAAGPQDINGLPVKIVIHQDGGFSILYNPNIEGGRRTINLLNKENNTGLVLTRYDSEFNPIWTSVATRKRAILPFPFYGTTDNGKFGDLRPLEMVIDDKDNIYVAGIFVQQIEFNTIDPIYLQTPPNVEPLPTITLTPKSWDRFSVYIAKCDGTTGQWLWANMIDQQAPWIFDLGGIITPFGHSLLTQMAISSLSNQKQLGIVGSVSPKRGDNFGYIAHNLDFEWPDLENPINLSLTAKSEIAIDLPFDFKFYDQTFSKIYINANGVVSVESSANTFWPTQDIVKSRQLLPDDQTNSLPKGAIFGLPSLVQLQPHYPDLSLQLEPVLIDFESGYEDLSEIETQNFPLVVIDAGTNINLDGGEINLNAIVLDLNLNNFPFEFPTKPDLGTEVINFIVAYPSGVLVAVSSEELPIISRTEPRNNPCGMPFRVGSQEYNQKSPYPIPALPFNQNVFHSPGSNLIAGFWGHYNPNETSIEVIDSGEIEYDYEDIFLTGDFFNTSGQWTPGKEFFCNNIPVNAVVTTGPNDPEPDPVEWQTLAWAKPNDGELFISVQTGPNETDWEWQEYPGPFPFCIDVLSSPNPFDIGLVVIYFDLASSFLVNKASLTTSPYGYTQEDTNSSANGIEIPFNFTFFNQSYDQVYPNRDGFLSFIIQNANAPMAQGFPTKNPGNQDPWSSEWYPRFFNGSLPPRFPPNTCIAAWWPREGFQVSPTERHSFSIDYDFVDISENQTATVIQFDENDNNQNNQNNQNNEGIATIPIGFPVTYSTNPYMRDQSTFTEQTIWNSLIVGKNGLISFWSKDKYIYDSEFDGFPQAFNSSPQFLPNGSLPNYIDYAPLWAEMDYSIGGTVQYDVVGEQPNRIFIVQWSDVPLVADNNIRVTFQIKIFEELDEEPTPLDNTFLYYTNPLTIGRNRIELHVKNGIPDPNITKVIAGSGSTFIDLSYDQTDGYLPVSVPDNLAINLNRGHLEPIKWEVRGEAPNRRMIIQWSRMRHASYQWNEPNQQSKVSNFQMKLFENGNRVEVHIQKGEVALDDDVHVIGMQDAVYEEGVTAYLDVLPVYNKAFDLTQAVSQVDDSPGTFKIAFGEEPETLIWEYKNMAQRGKYGRVDFQIKIYSSNHPTKPNEIDVYLNQVEKAGNMYHAIGFSNFTGTAGKLSFFDREPPANQTAYKIYSPALLLENKPIIGNTISSSIKYQINEQNDQNDSNSIIIEYNNIEADPAIWASSGVDSEFRMVNPIGQKLTSPNTFRIKLFEDGRIQFFYKEIGNYVNGYGGIQNLDASDGFTFFNIVAFKDFNNITTYSASNIAYQIIHPDIEEANELSTMVLPTFGEIKIGSQTKLIDSEFAGVGYIASLNCETGDFIWAKELIGHSILTAISSNQMHDQNIIFRVAGLGYDTVRYDNLTLLTSIQIPDYRPLEPAGLFTTGFRNTIGSVLKSLPFTIAIQNDNNGSVDSSNSFLLLTGNPDLEVNVYPSHINLVNLLDDSNSTTNLKLVIGSTNTCTFASSFSCPNFKRQGILVYNLDTGDAVDEVFSNLFFSQGFDLDLVYPAQVKVNRFKSGSDLEIFIYVDYLLTSPAQNEFDGILLEKTNDLPTLPLLGKVVFDSFKPYAGPLIGICKSTAQANEPANCQFLSSRVIECGEQSSSLPLTPGQNYAWNSNTNTLVPFIFSSSSSSSSSSSTLRYVATAITETELIFSSGLSGTLDITEQTLILSNENYQPGDMVSRSVRFDEPNIIVAIQSVPEEIIKPFSVNKLFFQMEPNQNLPTYVVFYLLDPNTGVPTKEWQRTRYDITLINDNLTELDFSLSAPVFWNSFAVGFVEDNSNDPEDNTGDQRVGNTVTGLEFPTRNYLFDQMSQTWLNGTEAGLEGDLIIRTQIRGDVTYQIIDFDFEDIINTNQGQPVAPGVSANSNEYFASIPLPFILNFFGSDAIFVRVSESGCLWFSNSNIEVQTGSDIVPVSLNPDIQEPGVAALWSNYNWAKSILTANLVQYAVLDEGTEMERMIIQFGRVSEAGYIEVGDGSEKISFQIKIFPNSIEVHVFDNILTDPNAIPNRKISGPYIGPQNPQLTSYDSGDSVIEQTAWLIDIS